MFIINNITYFVEINTSEIRCICKVIGITLTKYKDNKSQQLVRSLIIYLLTHHHDVAVEHLMSVFKILSCKELVNAPASKAAKAALIALGWTVLLNRYCKNSSNIFMTELPRLVAYQSILFTIIVTADIPKLTTLAESVIYEILDINQEFQVLYVGMLLKEEPSVNVLVTINVILKYKKDSSENTNCNLLLQHKTTLIDYFVKGIIVNNNKNNLNFITACSLILQTINEEEFETKILPPLQRALLRSPEIMLKAVGLIIREINIDFSPYALKIAKVLFQNLYSKDETARTDSVASIKELSMKINDADIIAQMLEILFGIFNGTEGKISVAEHRINIITVSKRTIII